MSEPVVFLPAEEKAWALECLAAGDTVEDIAEMSGRPLWQWRHQLGPGVLITERQRLVLRLYDAGMTFDAIAAEVGITRQHVWNELERCAERGLPVLRRQQRRAKDRCLALVMAA